jgi:iron complex transport system permease protein
MVVRSARPSFSVRMPTRVVYLTVGLTIVLLVAVCLATAYGLYPISPLHVAEAIIGKGSFINVFIIREVRLPRVVMGALVGGALGLAGAVFQGLSRNPLASPDILGITAAASTGVEVAIVLNAPVWLVPVGAFGGACVVCILLVLLGARNRHTFTMNRLLLVGIALNAVLGLLIQFLLTQPANNASYEQKQRLIKAQNWLAGSVSGATWFQIAFLAIGMVVLVPVILALGRQFNILELGEDSAAGLGVNAHHLQLALAGAGAFLTAIAVTAAGPIAFVAFLTPHIARRLARTASAASLPLSIVVGALLVLVADYTAKRIVEPRELPLSYTMTAIGAPYLLYLVWRNERDTGVA